MAMNNLENLATAIGTDIKDIKTQTANSQAKISANTESLNRIATQMDSLATKSEVKQGIDNLTKTLGKVQVGGRNYYRNSDKLVTRPRFIQFDVYPYLTADNIGQDWTFSFDLKINETGTVRQLHFYHYQRNGLAIGVDTFFNPSKEWQRYSFTAKVVQGGTNPAYAKGAMAIYDHAGDNDISIRNIKFEKGNVATDWSPAPEDAQNQVAETQESLRGLERKFETIASDVKVLNQKPEPRLTLTGNTLGIAGGNNVTLPLPDNVGHEIRGTGSPEGRITAEIGTTYVDVNMTNGALKWIKESGNGNTGWRVLIGDTGWRTLPVINKRESAKVQVRRINDEIVVKFDGLSRGWFGVDDLQRQESSGNVVEKTINGKNYTWIKLNVGQGNQVLPEGFRSSSSLLSGLYGDLGDLLGSVYVGGTDDQNAIQLRYAMERNALTSDILSQIRISPVVFTTDDPWPTKLP